MGILDDAIREHLELKRQHGVPEEELQRQEEEALGPARREVATAEAQEGNGTSEAAEADGAQGASEEVPVSDAPEHHEPIKPAAVSQSGTAEPEAEERPAPETPAPVDELPSDREEPPPGHEESVAFADTPPSGFEPVVDEEPLDHEPLLEEAEHDPVEDADGEPDETDPDLLEDTPDFLQETPEHDRLWFEQKPPRDFDFD